MDKLARMKELIATLNEWARLYYEEDAPVVSDAEYDRLYDELRTLEREEGYSLPTSPTHRVGGAPKGKFEQSKHLCAFTALTSANQKRNFTSGATVSLKRSDICPNSLANINSTVLRSIFCTKTAKSSKRPREATALSAKWLRRR